MGFAVGDLATVPHLGITVLAGFSGLSRQCAYLERIVSHGMAGVAIASGMSAPALTPQALATADSLDLPVLEVAYEVPTLPLLAWSMPLTASNPSAVCSPICVSSTPSSSPPAEASVRNSSSRACRKPRDIACTCALPPAGR